MSTRTLVALSTAVLGAALLAACGGGGGDAIPLPKIMSVKVMGDSLADVGTFGIKFTVQGVTGAPVYIYPELIAQSYGLKTHCNFYAFNGTTFAANATAGCTNFAIGGARINGATSGMVAADPRNVGVQLATAVAAGNHAATDLLLIDGGGNDAADLAGLYLGTAGGAAGIAAYSAGLKTLLAAATVDTTLATGAAGFASIGSTYMTALAGRFYDQIKANALDKGAKYVVVLNMPDITLTPRFQQVLAGVALANGGGTAGAAAATQVKGLINTWVKAFNTELAAKFTGNGSVLIVDFYTEFNNQVASPLTYGLQNATGTACPVTGTGTDGLPTYTFPTCTVTALSTSPFPAGTTGGSGWWQTYLFSDSFHPTPYGHQLLSNAIRTKLFNASWQ